MARNGSVIKVAQKSLFGDAYLAYDDIGHVYEYDSNGMTRNPALTLVREISP